MKLKKAAPPLPSGLVTVKKGVLPDIFVGVLTSGRNLAQGFDVSGFAPNHYRTIEEGNFGILVAAKTAIEVRVILDGQMLFEGIRQPLQAPMGTMDKAQLAALLETPQPHFFDSDVEGNAFAFVAADKFGRDDAEIVAQQIHPGYDGPAITEEQLASGEPMVNVRADYDPQKFFDKVKARSTQYDKEFESQKAAPPADVPVSENLLTAPISEDELSGNSNFRCEAVDSEAGIAGGAGSDISESDLAALADTNSFLAGVTVDEVEAESDASAVAADAFAALPLVDSAVRPLTLAPSQGYLVIGVRSVQKLSLSEPPGLPDAFSYVGFQLNPWNRHTRALARLMGRVIVPSKESLNETMRKQGFDHEIPASGPVCACCAGKLH